MRGGTRGPGRTGTRLRRAGARLGLGAFVVVSFACATPPPDTSTIELRWSLTPAPPGIAVGVLSVAVEVMEAGAPLRDADIRIHGLMTHPGMVPVIADAAEMAPGRYEAQLHLSMAGDWILLAEGTLADGRPVHGERPLLGVSPR